MRAAIVLALCAALAGCREAAAPVNSRDAGGLADVSARDAEPARGTASEDELELEPITPRSRSLDASVPDALMLPPEELEITYLGVGGFALRAGEELILTAPMYSNPSLSSVLSGTVRADTALIDRHLQVDVSDAKAILVGHAHYDHLLDVPHVFSKTRDAQIYGNTSVAHLLAATDPGPVCTGTVAPASVVPRDKIVVIDDPANDRTDYRQCPEEQVRCAGAWDGEAGEWIYIPNSNVRIRALCSSHPDQFLIFHLGQGCVDEEQCVLPEEGSDWREGMTLAYLIDFLDQSTGAPIFRVYYQDAPTTMPVGGVHAELLAEKSIDVALLCVGSYEQVEEHPEATIAALAPRFVIAGHWESFFKTLDEPIENIPFTDVDGFVTRMQASMPVDRAFKPNPGARFVFDVE